MDDDHLLPPDHIEACAVATEADPGAIWVIGETKDPNETVIGGRAPPQLNARGVSEEPVQGSGYWGISDGAAIYPRAVFDDGVSYATEFWFGAAYLEFGSLLYWLGHRIRHLSSTYVVHLNEGRSFTDPRMEREAQYFAMLAHTFTYQRKGVNIYVTFGKLAKDLVLTPKLTLGALGAAVPAWRRRAKQAHSLRSLGSVTRAS